MPDTKAQLLARLALARARVWRTLLALPAETLAGLPVAGDWTAKDTLAHLAFWDDTRADQLDLMLAGQIHELEWIDDSINTYVYEERRDWPIDRVVRALVTARARFLALLDPLADADLERTLETGDGKTVTLRQFVERRPRHDLAHIAPISDWRQSTKPDFAEAPGTVLAAALDASRAALLACGALIPAQQVSTLPVCGTWTWQDVLGHVADWEIYGVEGLAAMAGGRRVDTNPDETEWNTSHAAARSGEPLEKTWNDFVEAREKLLALLSRFDDASLAAPANSTVPFLSHYYFWFSVCALHDIDHADTLAETLVGSPHNP